MKTNGFKSDGLYDWLLKRDNKTDVQAKPVASSTNKKIVWQTKAQEPAVATNNEEEEMKEH
jgi:hypothetical protein